MELMRGYILYNEHGKRLTHNLTWSDMEQAGWLWTKDEMVGILKSSLEWQYKPAFYQRSVLRRELDGDVNVYAIGEIKAL